VEPLGEKELEEFAILRAWRTVSRWLKNRSRVKERFQNDQVEAEVDLRFDPGSGEDRVELLRAVIPRLPPLHRDLIEYRLNADSAKPVAVVERWAANHGFSRSRAFRALP
jgi:hypothetical protein